MSSLIRSFLALALLALSATAPAFARTVTDSAGRTVTLPDRIARVMAAGPPASAVVYCLLPEAMVGWQRAPRKEELPYLLSSTHNLPELGRLTGRGDTANVEVVLKANPDLIVDFGSVRPTFISLAEATQQRTGIPYVLVDGRFEATPASLRLLGSILGVPERGDTLAKYAEDLFQRIGALAAAIPEEKRPGVYLARGAKGLAYVTVGDDGTVGGPVAKNISESEREGLAAAVGAA
ncbi:MAG: iron ABC transporter substrate-binding protein, partial [Rhizobiales bacterium]|nr:iron ABC transporter substrate-binding protein [Hyphomicrobiales bacterium]